MQNNTNPALFWIGLSSIPGVGRITFRKLAGHFGSPERALSAGRQELQNIDGLSSKAIDAITSGSWCGYAEQELSRAEQSGVRIVLANSGEYPPGLLAINDPPLFLYVKGRLPLDQGLAVVGTRRPTHYGIKIAERISFEVAAAGLTVVSGMARGIDTQAHRGALRAKGRTVAVLGCGIDVVYPPENRELMQEIIRSGAVVSENPFGTRPEAGYFPGRNRIISGLSHGTVIIEAAEDSGSLITAQYAREQGRKVFAVPGNVSLPSSRGANSLIKQGAILIENASDILSALGSEKRGERAPGSAPAPVLNEEEAMTFSCITGEPKHIDAIMKESRTTAARQSGVLLALELKGLVKQLPGKFYVRDEPE